MFENIKAWAEMPVEKLKGHSVILLRYSQYVNVKFGKVEGDKYKRQLVTYEERMQENTILVNVKNGSRFINVEMEDVYGFMADAVAGTNYVTKFIKVAPEYLPIGNSLFQCRDLILDEVDILKYKYLAISGGRGYFRIPDFDVYNITVVFKDEGDNEISREIDCEYSKDTLIPEPL